MRKELRTSIFLMLCAVCSFSKGYAQQELNVNPAKGLLSVNVPVHSFDFPGFKVPIGVSYAARGFKVNDPRTAFVGWKLYGGGTIKRIIRGLPDEQNDTYYNRKGWNHDFAAAVPPTFTPYDDNNENNCADEAANESWLTTNFGAGKDLQPDIFVVDAPGLSCRIMLDNQGVYRAIPAQNLNIQFNVISSNNIDFVITTNSGIKYTFDLNSYASKSVTPATNNFDLFREEAGNYGNAMGYVDCWYLTRIDVQNEGKYAHLDYTYYDDRYESNKEKLNVFVKDGVLDTARESTLYEWNRSTNNRRRIKSITSSLGSKATFEGPEDIPTDIKIYYNLEPEAPVAKLAHFDNRLAYNLDNNIGGRNFLAVLSIDGPGCNGKVYRFKYYGVPDYGETGPAAFTLDLNSKCTDAWGFLNGSSGQSPAPRIYVYPNLINTTGVYRPYAIPGYSGTYYVLPGNDKTPNENTIAYGSLAKITYPTGGSSSFEYECNSFLDQDAGAEVKGAGIRIKAINHFDGLNTGTVMRKEFIYKNDAGVTSGTINMLPAYAISTPYYKNPVNGDTKIYSNVVFNYGVNSLAYWNYLTVRTKHDMYMGESAVSYTQVTTKETGNGKIKQVFSPSKSFWDTSSSLLSYAAQACNSSNSTFIVKGYNQYPFAPIEHWAGGDLVEEYIYNEAGNLLKKNEFEYENYHATPQRIYAILKDNNLGLKQFSKYYTEITGSILKKNKETIFDTNLSGNSLVTQTDYDNSAFNRKVRSKLLTNSDQTQVRTNYRYSGDFGPFHVSDQYSAYLDGLMTANGKNFKDEVIEETTELKPGGSGSFKLIAAKAKLYNGIVIGGQKFPVLKEVRTLRNLDGLTDFVPMQFTGSIPSRALLVDSRYKPDQVYTDFSNSLMPGTVAEKRAKTTLINDSLLRVPMLEVKGAGLEDIAFYNFDRMDRSTFAFYGEYWADYFKDPYFGRYVRFNPVQDFMRNFTRKAENKFYKIAFIARTDTATQLNILINNVVVSTVAVPVSAKFRFYEKTIDLSAITTGWLKLTTNGNVYLDNIFFYPADAAFIASNYDPVYGKTMEMNSSGVIRCFDYAIGKVSSERDLDGNITKAYFVNKYAEGSAIPYYASISVVNPTKAFVGREMKFWGGGSCLPGTKYIWDFGDGSTLESFDPSVSHVYASAATYTVSLTLQHPEYTNHTSSQSLLIRAAPVVVPRICASGITRINTCNNYIKYYSRCNPWTPGETDAPYGTKFNAWATGCPTGNLTFKWETSWDGVDYYEVGPYATGSQLYMGMGEYYMDTWVRCKITAVDCDIVTYTDPVFIEANCSVY